MKKYQIVYCFPVKKRKNEFVPEKYDDGTDKIYVSYVNAYNGGEAIDKLKKCEKFASTPDIMEVREVK